MNSRTALLSSHIILSFCFIIFVFLPLDVLGQESANDATFFELVRGGNHSAVKAQLLMSVDANMKNANGHTPLMFAVTESDARMVRLLLKYNAEPDKQDIYGQTALMYAVVKGDTAKVNPLLRHESDVNIANHKEKTALTLAAREEQFEITKTLLLEKAEVNHQDEYGWSALHFAAFKNNVPITDLLVKFGAEPTLKDNQGKMPHIYAAAGGYLGVIKEMRDELERSDFEVPDNNGWRAVHYAAFNGRTEIIKYLVKQGISFQSETPEGNTPLEFAKRKGFSKLSSYLSSIAQ